MGGGTGVGAPSLKNQNKFTVEWLFSLDMGDFFLILGPFSPCEAFFAMWGLFHHVGPFSPCGAFFTMWSLFHHVEPFSLPMWALNFTMWGHFPHYGRRFLDLPSQPPHPPTPPPPALRSPMDDT